MTPYRFALVRYVHDAAAGEFINIGVVLWPLTGRELKWKVNDRYGRLSRMYHDFDGPGYKQMVRHLNARFESIAKQWRDDVATLFDPAASSDPAPLQRILRDDASCFQWSATMGGIYDDLGTRLEQLFQEFVARHEADEPRERRTEGEIWQNVRRTLEHHNIYRTDATTTIVGPHYEYAFKFGWQNGTRQVLEPVSFDLLSPSQLVDKANTWTGRLFNLGENFQFTAVVAPPTGEELGKRFKDAIAILWDCPRVRSVIAEDQFDAFVPEILRDMEHAT